MSDLEVWADTLGINSFRGVFTRDMLPNVPFKNECGIINLGDIQSGGTHWTSYIKDGDHVVYFDSYGDAPPPQELKTYLNIPDGILYNFTRIQEYDDPPICGHLCLEVLRRHSKGQTFEEIERDLKNNKYSWLSWFL